MAEGPQHGAVCGLLCDPRLAAVLAQIALRDGPPRYVAPTRKERRQACAARRALQKRAVVGNLAQDPRQSAFSYLGLETEAQEVKPLPGEEQPVKQAGQEPGEQAKDRPARKKKGIRILGADVVWVFRDDNGRPILLVIFEVQTKPRGDRWAAWERYKAEARAQLAKLGYPDCPVKIIVVTLAPSTAIWARRGWQDDQVLFKPYVIQPKNIPVVDTDKAAKDNLALAVLSCAAHPDLEAVAAALNAALSTLSAEQQASYQDWIVNLISEEALMKNSELHKVESKAMKKDPEGSLLVRARARFDQSSRVLSRTRRTADGR